MKIKTALFSFFCQKSEAKMGFVTVEKLIQGITKKLRSHIDVERSLYFYEVLLTLL